MVVTTLRMAGPIFSTYTEEIIYSRILVIIHIQYIFLALQYNHCHNTNFQDASHLSIYLFFPLLTTAYRMIFAVVKYIAKVEEICKVGILNPCTITINAIPPTNQLS